MKGQMTNPKHFDFRLYRAGTVLYLVIPICLLLGLWWLNPVAGNAATISFILILLWSIGIGVDRAFVIVDERFDDIEAKLESIEDRIRLIQYK